MGMGMGMGIDMMDSMKDFGINHASNRANNRSSRSINIAQSNGKMSDQFAEELKNVVDEN